MGTLQTVHRRLVENGPQSVFEYLLFGGLWPLSCLYGLMVRMRRWLYQVGLKKSFHASVPVISIGNLTAGGTGKTPMTDYLVKCLRSKGLRSAIVSRGYGGQFSGEVGRVADLDGTFLMTPKESGDEPYLLASRNPDVPVYVASRRSDGVKQAEADGAQVIVLDDGFQHLAVARDLNILLLDARSPFGNGHMLPAGFLREPISTLQQSDLVVLTRAEGEESLPVPCSMPVLRCRHSLIPVLNNGPGETLLLQDVYGKRCLAFAGIAKPDTFFAALRQTGLQHLTEMPLADHQDYTPEILDSLQNACHNHDLIITTEKDAVKLNAKDLPLPCYSIGVELVFEETAPLDQLINQLMEPIS